MQIAEEILKVFTTGVGKLRPVKGKSPTHEHVIFLNGMRPTKESFATRENVNEARRAKVYNFQV